MDSYIVGLDPLPEVELDPFVTVLERASSAVLTHAHGLRGAHFYHGFTSGGPSSSDTC